MDHASFSRPVLGVSALLIHDQRILLAKRGREPGKGLWSLPGGKLERGETLHAAVMREVLEETGIPAQNLAFAEFAEIIQPTYHYVIAVFIGRLDDFHPPMASDDAADARWLMPSEIEALDSARQMTPGTFKRIRRLSAQPEK